MVIKGDMEVVLAMDPEVLYIYINSGVIIQFDTGSNSGGGSGGHGGHGSGNHGSGGGRRCDENTCNFYAETQFETGSGSGHGSGGHNGGSQGSGSSGNCSGGNNSGSNQGGSNDDDDSHSGQPHSRFACEGRRYGMFADVSNHCKIFVECLPRSSSGRIIFSRYVFRCPRFTRFDQRLLTCVYTQDALPCHESPLYYSETEEKFESGSMGNCRMRDHSTMKQEEHFNVHRLNSQLSSHAKHHETVPQPSVKESVNIDQLFADAEKRTVSSTSPRAIQLHSLPDPLRRLASLMFPTRNDTINPFTPRLE